MSRADPLRIADYLQHILEAIGNTRRYLGASPTKCVTHFRTAISR